MVESYQNLTKKLKREWYNFQIGTNEFLTEIFGEDEEEEDDNQIKDKNDQILRPGESTVTFWDVVAEWFEDFWTGFDLFGDSAKRTSEPEIQDNSVFSFLKSNSWLHGPYLRIWKRSLDEIERRKRYKK